MSPKTESLSTTLSVTGSQLNSAMCALVDHAVLSVTGSQLNSAMCALVDHAVLHSL